ncbi:uncharacterized protein [Setaria viridis]|uniref:uncharacterized protein n=1 Tax=Setaria viridis TaxID=4556 RepID=UPI003B3B9044
MASMPRGQGDLGDRSCDDHEKAQGAGRDRGTLLGVGRAMARAVGSVRVASLRGLAFLRLPPCTRAEALDVTAPRTTLKLPEAGLAFDRLAELSLALLQLDGARPLDEFLASCCPRLRTLRLRHVRGHSVRRLALRTGALEVLDLDTVDDLATLDVVAAKLRCLSVRSCFLLATDGDGGEVTVSTPRIEAVCWYRSYPEQLTFRDGSLAHVRRLAGPLKIPTFGRWDQFDAPYTTQLLRSCALAVDQLDMELVVPDEMALLNWLGDPAEARATCEDLIRHVPALPYVRVLSLKIRWGFGGGGVAPRLASFLSRTPSLTRLRIDASSYCLTVYEGEEAAAPPPRGKQQQWKRSDVGADEQSRVRLDGLREMSVDGLKGTDSEEHRLVQLLLASAPPSLERMSLTFRDAAASIVDEIAAEIPVHFPMATGRWDRCTTSVLTWTRVTTAQPEHQLF